MILSFIPYLIVKSRTKKKKSKDDMNLLQTKESRLTLKLEHYDIYEKKKWSKYKLIFASSFFDSLQIITMNVFYRNYLYNLWIFDIIFISLFSYLILKRKLYFHQYFSITIIIILGLILNIIQLLKNDESFKLDGIKILEKLLAEIFSSLANVIVKYNMEKFFCSPYEICLATGLIDFALISICLLILNIIGITVEGTKYPDNFFDYIKCFNEYDIIFAFLNIVISFAFNLCIFITCETFTPYHLLIILIIHECYNYLNIKENKLLNISSFFILALIAFIFLFFVEILELNIFGLSTNTKKNIELRAESDCSKNYISENNYSREEPDIDNESNEEDDKN